LLPKKQKELEDLEKQEENSSYHKDTVDTEDIAAVIAKRT
jgi:hypothetical protein